MSERILRVTVAAGERRSDLAVPPGVALAELVPDFARSVGLLDPAAVYAGYRVRVHGTELRPDRSLREQGVDDGALLAVTTDAEGPAPATHDDVAEATADAVQRRRAWLPADSRRATVTAGLACLAVGVGGLLTDPVGAVARSLVLGPGWGADDLAAVVLVLTVLTGNALPGLAAAAGVARVEELPVAGERLEPLVRRSIRFLLVGSSLVSGMAAALVPLVAREPAGAPLAGCCCGLLLLRGRGRHVFAVVLADVVGGLVVSGATVVTVLASHPGDRTTLAAIVAATGAAVCASARLPVVPPVRRARLLDVGETFVLVAVAPLLLVFLAGPAGAAGLSGG